MKKRTFRILLSLMAAATTLLFAGAASAVYVKPQGATINVVNEDESPFAGQTLTIVSLDDPGMTRQIQTDDEGRLCFVTDENEQTTTEDDEDTFSCLYLPDGKYKISGGLNARFTVVDGVPRFSALSQLSQGGKIGVGVGVVGLGAALSGGGSSSTTTSSTTDDEDTSSDTSSEPSAPAASVSSPKLDPTSAVFTHKVSVSPCPQAITTISYRNTSNVPVSVSVVGVPAQVTVQGIPGNTVPPGGTVSITLFFNCASAQSFQATLQFRSTAQGQTAQSPFSLQGNVQ